MKKITVLLVAILLFSIFSSCASKTEPAQIAATTLPVYEFTQRLCAGTDLQVVQLITENVSCLHDYSLQVSQMKSIEAAGAVVISGAGLEDFLHEVLDHSSIIIDASQGVHIHDGDHNHHDTHDTHAHAQDPHIWLSTENAKVMASNICNELTKLYPQHKNTFEANLQILLEDLIQLQNYGEETLSTLSCREMITFHDGFGYFAEAFDLTILHALEEESGSEASATELIQLTELVRSHSIPAIFTEKNGSTAAAEIIANEANISVYSLDMAISGTSYFEAMKANIDAVKEALA